MEILKEGKFKGFKYQIRYCAGMYQGFIYLWGWNGVAQGSKAYCLKHVKNDINEALKPF